MEEYYEKIIYKGCRPGCGYDAVRNTCRMRQFPCLVIRRIHAGGIRTGGQRILTGCRQRGCT